MRMQLCLICICNVSEAKKKGGKKGREIEIEKHEKHVDSMALHSNLCIMHKKTQVLSMHNIQRTET
jgi:hypothetical protein